MLYALQEIRTHASGELPWVREVVRITVKGLKVKGKEFVDSEWVKQGEKPETIQKIKAGFGKWAMRVGNLGLLAKAKQLYGFFLSPDVSGTKKTIVAGALLYVISPLDLIHDFIPVIGWLDDLGVAGFALNYIFSTMENVGEAKSVDEILDAEIAGTNDALPLRVDMSSRSDVSIETPDLTKLQARLSDLSKIAERLSAPSIQDNITRISDSLICGRMMRVGIVGRYSTGKSTLLNSLIGRDLLPTSNLPSTKVLTYIMRGDRPSVFLQYKDDGRIEVLPGFDCLRNIDSNQISAYGVSCPEIPYDDIVFVDTPGIQDTDTVVSQQTLDAVSALDAVVVVLDSNYLQSAAEFEFMESMLKSDRDRKLFVVINKVEDKNDKEIERLESLCRSSLVAHSISNARLYSVSAKQGVENSGFLVFAKELRRFLTEEIQSDVIAHAEAESAAYVRLLMGNCEGAMRAIVMDEEGRRRAKESTLLEIKKIEKEYDHQGDDLRKKLEQYRSRFFIDFSAFVDNLKVSVKDSISKRKLADLQNTEAIAVDVKEQIVKYIEERIDEINRNIKTDIATAQCNIENFLSSMQFPIDVKVRDLSQYSNLFVPVVVAASFVFCGFFTFVWCVIAAAVGRNFFEKSIESFLQKFGINSVREKLGDAVDTALESARVQLVDKLNESFDMLGDQLADSFKAARINAVAAMKMPDLQTDLDAAEVREYHTKLLSYTEIK